MNAVLRPGDVLRGMQLEAQPLCVGRARLADPVAVPRPLVAEPAAHLVQERVDAELRRLHDAAERAGYEEGLREGRAEAARESELARREQGAQAEAALAAERSSVRGLAASLANAAAEVVALAEDDMLALCFEVLCRVLGDAAPAKDVIGAQLRAAALEPATRSEVAVHVHPSDAELLAESDAPDNSRLRWVADAEVSLGGCIVRTAGGGLDMRFETALAACRQTLSSERGRRRAAGSGS